MTVYPINNIEEINHLIAFFVEKQQTNKAIKEGLTTNEIQTSISYILGHGIGLLLQEEDKVIGYIIGYKLEELFYGQKGVYTPEYGLVVLDNNEPAKEALLKELYLHMKEEGFTHHAITDINEVKNHQFLQLGYGLRVLDGVTKVKETEVDEDFALKKVTKKELEILFPMYLEHESYMASSPIFLDTTFGKKQLQKKLQSHDQLFLYTYKNEVVGYTTINTESAVGCELFFDTTTMSLKSTHIRSIHQHKGYGKKLIDLLHQKATSLGKKKIAVDFEIFNTKANRFWPKHFNIVAHSYVRYIG